MRWHSGWPPAGCPQSSRQLGAASIVDEDELVAASSGLWSAAVISQIALAPLVGALVTTVGVGPAFLVNAASFAAFALLLAGLRPPGRPSATAAGSWPARIDEGARLLVAHRLLALVQLLAALSAGATSALLVVLAGQQLDVGPDGFGLLLAAIGAGAALGPLLLARLVSNPPGQHGCSGHWCCAASSTWSWPGGVLPGRNTAASGRRDRARRATARTWPAPTMPSPLLRAG
jgi:MFS family permease